MPHTAPDESASETTVCDRFSGCPAAPLPRQRRLPGSSPPTSQRWWSTRARPERGYSYHPSRHSAGQPIVAGRAYQWVAQLGLSCDSWSAPVNVRRVHPSENANAVAVVQITRLAAACLTGGGVPRFVFDAGYDPLQLSAALGDTPAAILVRLHHGRCFSAEPAPIAASAARSDTARSLSATIRSPGRPRPTSEPRTSSRTARSARGPGQVYMLSRGRIAVARSGCTSRSCRAGSSWSRSGGSQVAPASRMPFGSGGMVR